MDKEIHKKSYLNFIDERSRNLSLLCNIHIRDKIANAYIIDICLSSVAGMIFYGVEHHWAYGIIIDSKEIIYRKCVGGAWIGMEDRMIDIIEKFPKLIDFIVDNFQEIKSYTEPYYSCFISRETGEVIKRMEEKLP